MSSKGNGHNPPEIDYNQLAMGHFDDMVHFLEMDQDTMAVEEGEAITWTLYQDITDPAQRSTLLSDIKNRIAKLPHVLQTRAYGFCKITPDDIDPLDILARAVGVEVPTAQPETEGPSADEKARPKLIPDVPIINPALDYAGGVVYIAQQMTTTDEEETVSSRPIVFTSERDYFAPPTVKKANEVRVLDTGVAIDKTMDRAGRGWSLPAILKFLEDESLTVSPWDLYHRLERVYIERIWFAEPGNYMIMALYTMLSYAFVLFDAVPYLHFTGLAGSGKTHAARLLATLAFNGHVEVDPTEASLFRTIESTRGLVVLDDQETGVTNRANTDNPFMTILKTGYKRGGRVTRMERRGNEYTALTFDVYCPKAITNVFGLEDILADRTIPILMREIPANLQASVNTSALRQKEAQPLIDDLYLFTMVHLPKLAEVAGSQTRHRSRTEEIFWPLYALAMYADSHAPDGTQRSLLAELGDILNEKAGLRTINKGDTPESILRLALLNLLEKKGRHGEWFSTREIEKEFYMLHSSPPDWYNDRWLGKNISKVCKIREQDKKRGPNEETVCRFDYRTGRELDELEVKRFTYYFIRREAL